MPEETMNIYKTARRLRPGAPWPHLCLIILPQKGGSSHAGGIPEYL